MLLAIEMTKYRLNEDLRAPSQVTLTSYMVGEGQSDEVGNLNSSLCDDASLETRVADDGIPPAKDDLRSRLECTGCAAKSEFNILMSVVEKGSVLFVEVGIIFKLVVVLNLNLNLKHCAVCTAINCR